MLVVAAIVAAAGCKDMGLDELQEYELAVVNPPAPLVLATTPPLGVPPLGLPSYAVQVGNRTFQSVRHDVHLPDRLLRQVGSSGPVAFHALAWDQEPYDRLFARTETGYMEFADTY